MNIGETDVSVAHRIGRKPNGTVDRRSIIIKLCRRDLVRDIYSACKELKPSFYVNDSLTPTRSKIAFTIRQLKNKFPDKIKGCRSYNGEPRASIVNEGENVRRTRNSTMSTRPETSQIVITTKEELDNFVRDHLKTSLVDLSMQW